MCQDFVNENAAIASPHKFNPILIKCDDHKGNRNGIEAIYGKEFLESRTSSRLYHFDKSVKKHVCFIFKEHQDVYYKLLNDLKDCHTRFLLSNKKELFTTY